jgi:hypothetical protein
MSRPTLPIALLGLWLAAAACAHAGVGVALQVEANVPDATIWVDDVLIGKVADWARDGRHIRPGFHRVEIRAPGYYSVYQEVDQPEGGRAAVKATLRPLLE